MNPVRFSMVVIVATVSFWLSAACTGAAQSAKTSGVDAATTDNVELSQTETDETSSEKLTETLEGEFDTTDIAATTAWAESLHLADWLGPLAPVALSPFFGIALLSGLALYGPDWITDNALLGASGPLQNPTLFWIFVGLTVLTSLPRLTKVSKPIAQALDRLETYAVIVILLVIKVVAAIDSPDPEPQVAMIQFGVISFTADTLLAVAMVINILIINSVKFFFEFLVWLTPVPFLDAVFEICNKTICAALMAVYAYSPTVATVINLGVLVVAALILRWISRRVTFYRTMVLDPILAKLWTGFGSPRKPELIVFPQDDIGPFPAKSRLTLCRDTDGKGWQLKQAGWWTSPTVHPIPESAAPTLHHGWVMHTIRFADGSACSLVTSRRYDAAMDRVAETLLLKLATDRPETDQPADLRQEFA
ncbi:hypothetical protein [Crateriforma conspicua]|uniref:hypothetical protein n=1 Tax=Crateriforma conspicua TaxID=2527996 RepID=UPI00118C6C9C|nr:hypothetical protein [Crateriforma conspicua]QDV61718.1 hypothetical protein Mal65_08450 [Crateriforma conspicua]